MSVREYGDLTPRELMLIVEAHNERRDREDDDALIRAYTLASFHKANKLPNLDNLLAERRKRRKLRQEQQTPEQMLAEVMRIQKRTEGE